jgi:hypothetical protein
MNYKHIGHVIDVEKHAISVHYTPKKWHKYRPKHIWASTIFFWKKMKQAKGKQRKKNAKVILYCLHLRLDFDLAFIPHYQPLEVVRQSFVASKPFSTYTLIGS